jgi:hypothetical protein
MDDARRDEVLAEISQAADEWLRGAQRAYPEGFDIGTIGIAFDLHMPDETALVGYYCSDGREWVHAGLFRAAMLEADSGEGANDSENGDSTSPNA